MHAPDVQGTMANHTTELIQAEKPDAIMIGGPPFYLGGFKVDEAQLRRGVENLKSIIRTAPVTILEHHALRDEGWKQKIEKVMQIASASGHSILTAAEYTGKENTFLESRRKQIYNDHPPSAEFKQWMKTLNNKKIAKPPI